MKKYAVMITCLAMLGGALQTPGFAQTGAGTSGSPGAAGAGTSQNAPGTPGSSPGAGQSGSILNGSRAGQPGSAISDPSGTQQQVGVITIQGKVKSETEKRAIETQLKQLPGVTSVRNMLQVSSDANQRITDPSGAQPGATPDPGTADPETVDPGTSDKPESQPGTPSTPPATP